MLPILIPLKAVVRDTSGEIGSRSLRQRRARSQNANEPAAIDRSTNSQRQDLRDSTKEAHSTSRKENHRSTPARAAETAYFIIFLSCFFIFLKAQSYPKVL
jgi:hypothetical protein